MSDADIRPFDRVGDMAAVKRIWREVGWVDRQTDHYLDDFLAVGQTLVGTIDGVAECSVHIVDGTMRLQTVDLPLCAVTAVTTSRIARGRSFARRITAAQLRAGYDHGAAVAALGMFDQGFYDQLGFGSGAYEHRIAFDPATLKVSSRVPTPQRLDVEDYERMHAAMVHRHKAHGAVSLHPAQMMRAEFGWIEGGFGLGYGTGATLTHFLFFEPKNENGPYTVSHMVYQNDDQLLELLGLLKSLADQVYSVRLIEPPGIQMMALLDRPFRHRAITAKSDFAARQWAMSWWQTRILDVPRCVSAFAGRGAAVKFQLVLEDPVAEHLDDNGWQGVAGRYVVELGEQSSARLGEQAELPTLSCTVNTFTRLLWGVSSPSALKVTDGLQAPASLLVQLDAMLQLPTPYTGWDF